MPEDFGSAAPLAAGAAAYLTFLDGWVRDLQPMKLRASTSAVLAIDLIEGFCTHGNLASPRVNGIVAAAATLLDQYARHGGTHVCLPEDAHSPNSREFLSFPPHCVAGSEEAQTVGDLRAIEEASWRHFPKHSTNGLAEPALAGEVSELLAAGVSAFVLIGDCTDLCVYQAALSLQVMLNRFEGGEYRDVEIVVPEEAVQTYDLQVAGAAAIGAQPHPGNLLHAVFLHHMALNGVRVVQGVEWID